VEASPPIPEQDLPEIHQFNEWPETIVFAILKSSHIYKFALLVRYLNREVRKARVWQILLSLDRTSKSSLEKFK
jgi:hypothetical protein